MPSQNNVQAMDYFPASAVKIGSRHQIVIPNNLFKEMGLRIGDYLEARKEKGKIVFEPKALVPKEDLWFHSKEWQEGEAEADRDIAEGRISKEYTSVKELMKDLNS